MNCKDEKKKKGFIKLYYELLEQGMPAAECVMYCNILSYYVDKKYKKDKNGYMVFIPKMLEHIKIGTRQKARIMEKLVNNKYIQKQQKAGSYIFKIKVLKDKIPSSKSKWWKIENEKIADVKIDEKTKRSDYTLLLIKQGIKQTLNNFSCVNFDKVAKKLGFFTHQTIRDKLLKIDILKPFMIDGRLYLTSKKAYKQMTVPPENTNPDKEIYNTNDVYKVCKLLGLVGDESIEVLRTYNAMGRILYMPIHDEKVVVNG